MTVWPLTPAGSVLSGKLTWSCTRSVKHKYLEVQINQSWLICYLHKVESHDRAKRFILKLATGNRILWTNQQAVRWVWDQDSSAEWDLLTSFCCFSSSFIRISRASALAARLAANRASACHTDQYSITNHLHNFHFISFKIKLFILLSLFLSGSFFVSDFFIIMICLDVQC